MFGHVDTTTKSPSIIYMYSSGYVHDMVVRRFIGIESFHKAKSRQLVRRSIQGEKSNKDMASSRNLVSTIVAQASPKKGDGIMCPKGKLRCWHSTHVANAPWKPLIIR